MSLVVPPFFRGKVWHGFTLGICAVVMTIALSIFAWSAYSFWQLQNAEPRLREMSGVVEGNEPLLEGRTFLTRIKAEGGEALLASGTAPIAPGQRVRVLVDPEEKISARVLFAGESVDSSLAAMRRLVVAYMFFVAGVFLAAGWVAGRAYRRVRR